MIDTNTTITNTINKNNNTKTSVSNNKLNSNHSTNRKKK